MSSLAEPRQPYTYSHLIDRPILVVGCNRSGTTLLFRNLAEHPVTWSLYEESQDIFYQHYPIDRQEGDRITRAPAPDIARQIVTSFHDQIHNKEIFRDRPGLRHIPRKLLQRPLNRLYKKGPLRLVEKTPANCLRIPLLARLFPDALFVFLVRRAEEVISSLMEGWKYWSGTGDGPWRYSGWHYIVPPGWQEWIGRPLQDIYAFQWVEANRYAWTDLKRWCDGRFILVRHEDALREPEGTYRVLRKFCQLPPSKSFDQLVARAEGRIFTHGGSKPRRDKWRHLHEREVESVRHMFEPLLDRLYSEQFRPPRLSTADG